MIDLMEKETRYRNSNESVFLIAIDGYGGAGKSTLADLLAQKLSAGVIHTDDFASWNNPTDWWSLLIEKVLDPIKSGAESLSYPRSKWWENHHPEPVTDQPVTPIMILEGVGALRKEFRPYISYGIFVETNQDTSLARGLNRDNGQDGKSIEEIHELWKKWRDSEEAYIKKDNPREWADLIVNGTKPYESQMSELLKKLMSK